MQAFDKDMNDKNMIKRMHKDQQIIYMKRKNIIYATITKMARWGLHPFAKDWKSILYISEITDAHAKTITTSYEIMQQNWTQWLIA